MEVGEEEVAVVHAVLEDVGDGCLGAIVEEAGKCVNGYKEEATAAVDTCDGSGKVLTTSCETLSRDVVNIL